MLRISAVVLVIGCLLAGYAAAGYRVSASDENVVVRTFPSGMNIGDTVNMTFGLGTIATGTAIIDCKIAAFSGGWVGCERADNSMGSAQDLTWYDISRVASLKKVGR